MEGEGAQYEMSMSLVMHGAERLGFIEEREVENAEVANHVGSSCEGIGIARALNNGIAEVYAPRRVVPFGDRMIDTRDCRPHGMLQTVASLDIGSGMHIINVDDHSRKPSSRAATTRLRCIARRTTFSSLPSSGSMSDFRIESLPCDLISTLPRRSPGFSQRLDDPEEFMGLDHPWRSETTHADVGKGAKPIASFSDRGGSNQAFRRHRTVACRLEHPTRVPRNFQGFFCRLITYRHRHMRFVRVFRYRSQKFKAKEE